MEGVGQAVGRDVPAFGYAGNSFGRDRIESGQTFEKPEGNAGVCLTGDDGWIERLRLEAIDYDDIGARFGRGASGKKEGCEQTCDNNASRRIATRRRSPFVPAMP